MRMLKPASLLLLLIVGLGGYLSTVMHRFDFKPAAAAWQPAAAPASSEVPKPRQPCRDYRETGRAFFGDLHVHTSVSFDAASRGVLATADDAYRFARGEPLALAPYKDSSAGRASRQLSRPLDFAAVTDHAEWIGEVVVCSTEGTVQYHSEQCRRFREGITLKEPDFLPLMGLLDRAGSICGENNRVCREALAGAWEDNQRASEAHYDRSADCSFTTFHAYEYSNSVSLSKVHRNVIFKNERVPELPVSSLEQPDPKGLWDRLDAQCVDASPYCEAISIPHNANVSNGRMFVVPYRAEFEPEQQRQARQRARWEPLVEMMQIKGESECANDLWKVLGEDEFFRNHKIRPHPAPSTDHSHILTHL